MRPSYPCVFITPKCSGQYFVCIALAETYFTDFGFYTSLASAEHIAVCKSLALGIPAYGLNDEELQR